MDDEHSRTLKTRPLEINLLLLSTIYFAPGNYSAWVKNRMNKKSTH